MRIRERWAKNDVGVWTVTAGLFALGVAVAPTFISYRPYLFKWDDAEYFGRAIYVNLCIWTGNTDGIIQTVVSPRAPMMTLMGMPWGRFTSWHAAGNCFITLAALSSAMIATCLCLLMRIGVKPVFVCLAGACVFLSMGPFPPGASAHDTATGFLADNLFAWIAVAAVLLVPYEARAHGNSIVSSFGYGVLEGFILSLGVATKLSFLYFVLALVPVLLLVKFRNDGPWKAVAAGAGFSFCAVPLALYLIKWGRPTFLLAKASSFGVMAHPYYIPLWKFFADSVRESPGLLISFILTAAGLLTVIITRPLRELWADYLALLIIFGYGLVVLSSPNREIRFLFPVIIGFPVLLSILLSDTLKPVRRAVSIGVASLVLCGLIAASAPMRYRPDFRSISRCIAILNFASKTNSRTILLATDSSTLNHPLMMLAREFSDAQVADSTTLAYEAVSGLPIEADMEVLGRYDLVVFQDGAMSESPYTNQRVPAYERHVRRFGSGPIRLADDLSVYLIHH